MSNEMDYARECCQYVSTRSPDGQTYSFEDALLMGFALDGGLFVPRSIPKISRAKLSEWSGLSYPDLVVKISRLFISQAEMPDDDLSDLIHGAFSQFPIPEIIRTQTLSETPKAIVVELFNGATLAFKDLAMTCTAKFLQYFLAKRQGQLHILVATSGDTGAAALSASGGSSRIQVTVLYPLGRVTEIQELQMKTLAAAHGNLQLIGINGTSDDGDEIIKQLFADTEFSARHHLSSVNSINWSRILIQIAHHFFAYFKTLPLCVGQVEIVCPTGAAGNLAAGFYAQTMGLPIRLVACVNENDFVRRALIEGRIRTDSVVHQTLASAMDIQMAYNIERILYVASNGDKDLIRNVTAALDSNAEFRLPINVHEQILSAFSSSKSTDDDILKTIKKCWEETQYRICPHTATAVHYHYKTPFPADIHGRACLATASPLKFPETLTKAGVPMPDTSLLDKLCSLPQKALQSTDKIRWVSDVKKAIESTKN